MTTEEYWAALKSMGVTRMKRLTPESILCQDRDGELLSVEDPTLMTPERRASAIAFYARRINPFDA